MWRRVAPFLGGLRGGIGRFWVLYTSVCSLLVWVSCCLSLTVIFNSICRNRIPCLKTLMALNTFNALRQPRLPEGSSKVRVGSQVRSISDEDPQNYNSANLWNKIILVWKLGFWQYFQLELWKRLVQQRGKQ
jgi:hypothetical protein